MDIEFTEKLNSFGIWKGRGDESEQSEFFAAFHALEDGCVKIQSDKGEFVYRLKPLQDLFSAGKTDVVAMKWDDPLYMSLLHAIESAIKRLYEEDPQLTDGRVMLALDKLSLKPETVSDDPVIKAVNNSMRFLLSTTDYSRDEVKKAVRKILVSVKRHNDFAGIRGYLDFILEHVP
jgi:hypothetical protein